MEFKMLIEELLMLISQNLYNLICKFVNYSSRHLHLIKEGGILTAFGGTPLKAVAQSGRR